MDSNDDHSDDDRDDDRKDAARRDTYHRDENRDWAAESERERARRAAEEATGALVRGDWETALKAQGEWPDFLAARHGGSGGQHPASGPGRAPGSELAEAIQEASRELDVAGQYLSVEAVCWIRRFLAGISLQEDPACARHKAEQLLQVARQLKAWQPNILDLLAEDLRTVARRLTARC